MVITLFYLGMAATAVAHLTRPTPPAMGRLDSRQDRDTFSPFVVRDVEDGADNEDVLIKVFVTPDRDTTITDGHYQPDQTLDGRISPNSSLICAWTEDQFSEDQERGEDHSFRPFTWWISEPNSNFTKWVYYLHVDAGVSHSWRGTANYTLSTESSTYKFKPYDQDIAWEDVCLDFSEAHCLDEQMCEQYPWPFTKE